MSGGSYNYIYSNIKYDLVGKMHDPELNEMISDLVVLLHDLEWWRSGDKGEEDYRDTVNKFKKKWFNTSRKDMLKRVIDKELEKKKNELYRAVGIEAMLEEEEEYEEGSKETIE